MIDIALQAIANQSLSIPLDNSRFVLTVKESNGAMVMTVVRDDVVLVQNARMTGDNYVIPYDYLRVGMGNFFMSTQGQAIPFWDQFGLTQFLVYATADEIAASLEG